MTMRSIAYLCLGMCCLSVSGQEIPTGPSLSDDRQPAAPRAISGEPFGVLQVEVPLPPGLGSGTPRVLVEDPQGRVFYPVVSVRTVEVAPEQSPPLPARRGRLLERLRSAIRGPARPSNVPVAITISALFRGTEPLDLQLVGDINQGIHVQPQASSSDATHAQLLTSWWSEYTHWAQQTLAGDDFPKLVHMYLTSMLSARLGLPQVDLDPPDPNQKELSQPLKTLALLAAIEPLQEEILQDVLNSPSDDSAPNQPVPPEPLWEPVPLPALPPDVAIETLATRVPPECFYLRFGAFSNYVWFQEIAERYGGDIAQSVILRGFNHDASARMERMLASKLTTIAKMFGDRLVSDMAVVGSDLYMKEGASLGVLFLASNPELLIAAMETDRKAVLSNNPDARLSEVTIAGRSVSLLSTPDNRIRSFVARDGEYLFVSTSQTLVRRFLEVSEGGPSLANSASFRWARTWMPDANDYSVFAYFSPEFFHRLVSPQYQIELRRRLVAMAHIASAEVALQVAASEGLGELNIGGLQQAGLLAPWFDQRTDGARILRTEQGWIDSMRGARGSFLPIADVELRSVSQRESDEYASIAKFYQEEWRHMDPLLLGLRRFRGADDRTEQVAVEAYIAPFEAEKYGWIARQLAAPTPIELQLPGDDAVSVQMHIRGGRTLGIESEDYHLFGGVKDMQPPDAEETQGLIRTLQALKVTPAYIGGWPRPGIVEQLPLGLGLTPPDAAGFSRMLGGLWRWQDGHFSLLSFNRAIIEQAIPQLGVAETQDLAQARAKVANLQGTQLAAWINRKWYQRGWEASQGNALLLDAIHQQLRVPTDQCLSVAERVLDVRLQCPLGGTYQFQPLPAGRGGWWESTAWNQALMNEQQQPTPPADYSAPWIDWFRGGQVHVTQGPGSLAVVGNIALEMQPLAVELSPILPNKLPPMTIDLFSLPMKLFGGPGGAADRKPATKSF